MDRVLKVAMPPDAATVVGPLGVPPPGLLPRPTVTFDVSGVPRLPYWSSTSTVTAGLIATAATAVPGWRTTARWSAAAGVMLKAPEVAPPRLPSLADRVNPVPTLLMDRVLKLATPPDAATVV